MKIFEVESLNCRFCGKESANPNSHRNHERLCPQNPDRKLHNIFGNKTKGRNPWNKGKSVTNNPELATKLGAGGASLAGFKPHVATSEYWTDEQKRKKSEWRKQLHKDHPETHPNRRLAGNRNKMTYPEKVAFECLTKIGVQFEHQKQIGRFFPDFVIGNVIIEIDGARWHNTESDQKRDALLSDMGYKVYRINSKERIEDRIKEILGA